ncbi:MAG TPA: response regulator [Pyrinomonadaceae bacterium]|jgi:signal transduction histidine kinase/ActR/RegA family two-component response regulator
MQAADRQRLAMPYMWAVACLGALICIFSLFRVSYAALDLRFLLLALITFGIGSRITIGIPRFKSEISISDTFILLTMLLYGGEAAIILAAAEACLSSTRFGKRLITYLFNAAVMTVATFCTVWALRFTFGSIEDLTRGEYSAKFVMAVCLMAFVQYVVNSGLVAIGAALKSGKPLWQTWKNYYLWTSLTYFAGASAAAITARLVLSAGSYALVAMVPVLAILHFTYQTYLKNVETSAAVAEQAQRHVEELSRYIAEQERIREQFSQLEKLSALGELASGVAHDFNNTLAGILGRAELLLRTSDPEKLRRGLNIIIRSAEDGAKTVKRIQDFARQRRDHDFAPVAVDQLLFDVSEITRPRWKIAAEAANVHINLDVHINTASLVMGDASEMREVLVNMVFNAVDAMPQGGRLTLSAEEVDGQVEISVRDTGVGMTSEVRSRIFDPFFTTKGKAGMGLGLAVGYGIIRRHNGIILVESEVGSGTTFCIRMPVAEGVTAIQLSEPQASALPVPSEITPLHTKILVVDDEDYVRELLRDILASEGYSVTLAGSGSEALALYDAMEFDAVFTDIGMPGMSGWELARAIRERSRQIPIAVITGWGEAVGSTEQKEAQVDWVVTKPFTTSRIVELAQEVSEILPKETEETKLRVLA